jgi:hypothetical protein
MMGDIIQLRSPIDINTDAGRAFVVDATRAGEGLISDQDLQQKYELSAADWRTIEKDEALGRAIRDERDRRLRSGVAAREAAAKHFVKMPAILAGIAENVASNPRLIIEAAKEIRQAAAGSGDDGPSARETISIVINLGNDVGDRIERTFDVKPRQLDLDLESKSDGDR